MFSMVPRRAIPFFATPLTRVNTHPRTTALLNVSIAIAFTELFAGARKVVSRDPSLFKRAKLLIGLAPMVENTAPHTYIFPSDCTARACT